MVSGTLNQKHSDNSKLQTMSTSIKDWLKQEPEPDDVAPAPERGLHIPIEKLENNLDHFNWSTQSFHWHIFKNGYGDNVIAASIELVLEYTENKKTIRRSFVGGCNFSVTAIFPNVHYIATAKSMCIKNAASDAGKKLGRGMNAEVVPTEEAKKEANDGVEFLDSLDQIKPEHHVKERKNIQNKDTK